MRKDMFKVIVERPRHGSRSAPKIKNRHDPDQERKQVGMKRAVQERSGGWKSLNENLAPLKRYLGKQKGRPWSKVYAEISKQLAPGHTVKDHVRDHLEDFIVIRVSIGKKGEWLRNTKNYANAIPLHEWWPELYVDPNDGIIKETARLRKKLGIKIAVYRDPNSAHCPESQVDIGYQACHLKINGVWYLVHYGDPVMDPKPGAKDMIEVWIPGIWQRARENDEGQILWVWLIDKQQLKKAELKKAGLKND